eukprot:TRINITY_DN416_c0_g1_i1.p1 TRINITY_DN416_c0_g1~~TRINITY_DN416_c0_g1_i1.p1  ORF type:complete len:314 (+),score=69.27 TRINITY_DN416_c0_g1_i1:89-1030(+)
MTPRRAIRSKSAGRLIPAQQIHRKDVVNLTHGVHTEDGRVLYGLDAETYLKIKESYDVNEEKKVGEWIEFTLGEKLEPPDDLWKALKSGIILCRLLNKVKPGSIKKFNSPKKNKELHPLMERENIGLYLEACWKLGVQSSDMFITSDLHGKRYMKQVLQNIAAISQISMSWNSNDGSSDINILPPKLSLPTLLDPPKPVKRWPTVQTSGPLPHVNELIDEDSMDEELDTLKRELDEAKALILKLQHRGEEPVDNADDFEISVVISEDEKLNEEFAAMKSLLDSKEEEIKNLVKELEEEKSKIDYLLNKINLYK